MPNSSPTLIERIHHWNETGTIDIVAGIVVVFFTWLYIPVLGLIAAWIGYRLYSGPGRTVAGGAIAGLGLLGFALWLLLTFLVSRGMGP